MPSGEKKAKQTDQNKEVKDLVRLLELLSSPASKQQLPSIESEESINNNNNNEYISINQGSEALALEKFSTRYQQERHFSSHEFHKNFYQIFTALVKHRLCSSEWVERAPPENIVRILICLRLFLRDPYYQKKLFELGGVKVLTEKFQTVTKTYLGCGEQDPFMLDILKEMTNIFQKLSGSVRQRSWLIACSAHEPLVMLLSANDVLILHCSLHALTGLTSSADSRKVIAELDCIETLLGIIQDYDIISKKLSASLLRILCQESQVREQIKICDGVPMLLSILHYDNIQLLWNVVWCLTQLAEDPDSSNDIRVMGGIPLLLSLLDNREFSNDKGFTSVQSANPASRHMSMPSLVEESGEEVSWEQRLSLQAACCAALTQLVLNDTNAQLIVQNNGIYSIGMLIFPKKTTKNQDAKAVYNLQKNAFRALRFLFSMERNRRLFKRLFSPDLFAVFIDVGHYTMDIEAYVPIVEKLNSLPETELSQMKVSLQDTNQNREPSQSIEGYSVYEHLGTGAFGSVYKVKKNAQGKFLALKEISFNNPAVGRTAKEKEKSIASIISELSIIKEDLRHPNVVRYFRTFTDDKSEKLYIVMDLIEGAPLHEHFNSLREKKLKFPEDRIWNIFVQIVLALRYLHKEKGIVHRDLTPNNIMLGENDKVTITDFGLARQKQPDCSKMTSVVGTILYSCPELVQNLPYSDKADVWAIGCILYQMCKLEPPFFSSNMLSLATKIVAADYEPIKEGEYSQQIISTIQRCLTPKAEDRPDIIQVASLISDVMMTYIDNLRNSQISLEKKLERERKRTQKHYHEATVNMQNYHRLFLASQERYDRLANLSGSGGAASIKSDSDPCNDVFDSADELSSSASQSEALRAAYTNLLLPQGGREIEKSTGTDSSGIDEDDRSTCDSLESSSGSSSLGVSQYLNSSQGHRCSPSPTPPSVGSPSSHRRVKSAAIQRVHLLSGIQPLTSDLSTNPGCRIHRSQSGSFVETLRRQSSLQKLRPTTAAATLTISPRKVRQISDPVLKMLHIIHKIIFISQLPPTLSPNPRRKVIERFKRALFSPQSTIVNLKSELKKVVAGSKELIDINLGVGEACYLLKQASREENALQTTGEKPATVGGLDPNDTEIGITYEQLQNFIESVLVESGYYDMSPSVRHKTIPLGPITNSPRKAGRQLSYDT
ncbi:Serine/threonine-protein kinase Nek10 [Holothuria leucospilota]|uniref:Serine/threonine-protein kinase Nek10 n=1 Tax=Holothuria leucospilota TaxID=206669 RepID=A0A9Q0YLI4_HOLLE|nr:Serine/threonine-protein kinase Nek10 [Holothuria leucospilota]